MVGDWAELVGTGVVVTGRVAGVGVGVVGIGGAGVDSVAPDGVLETGGVVGFSRDGDDSAVASGYAATIVNGSVVWASLRTSMVQLPGAGSAMLQVTVTAGSLAQLSVVA